MVCSREHFSRDKTAEFYLVLWLPLLSTGDVTLDHFTWFVVMYDYFLFTDFAVFQLRHSTILAKLGFFGKFFLDFFQDVVGDFFIFFQEFAGSVVAYAQFYFLLFLRECGSLLHLRLF